MVRIEVFTAPGCGRCGRAKTVLAEVLATMTAERYQWREVNILEEIDYAVELGVLATPAIAINGELVFSALPSSCQLQDALLASLPDSNV